MKTDRHQQELPFTPNSNMTYQSNHTFYALQDTQTPLQLVVT
jgi:hypothetical protein